MRSSSTGHDWALVLAGGEGSRLHSLTMTASGVAVPKQFCSFGSDASLLHDAMRRAQAVSEAERTCVVVSEHHRLWWEALDLNIPPGNVIQQPRNRGTATGILLPLLEILRRDPDAALLVLPSDHFVRDESLLAPCLRAAILSVRRQPGQIVILGITPDEPDPELGYIVAEDAVATNLRSVSEFVEKPSMAAARVLIARGGVWNSFIFAAHGKTLLDAFEQRSPELVADMRQIISITEPHARQAELAELYERAPALDFSRDILQRFPSLLRVLTVPACGWSDLGTPHRVTEALSRFPPRRESARRANASSRTSFLDLAQLPLSRPVDREIAGRRVG
ncbi:MAG TPA: sugar phosphate nucleotidyltransferase [Steroidobacter sp.]|uniref:sugar phosphate nucleotidyltransferase n=1 Tax=Steroidobacter sp. TaxID=1978227 RepID=UPI002ED8AC4F